MALRSPVCRIEQLDFLRILAFVIRHCEPTGRANARPMINSAKQSRNKRYWIASSPTLLAMTDKIGMRSGDGLNALDHVLIFRAILFPDRLDRVLERRLVGDLDDLAAGGLGLVHRLLLVLIPQLALLELGLAGEFPDQVLVVGGQRAPDPLGENQHFGNDQMFGPAEIFGGGIV